MDRSFVDGPAHSLKPGAAAAAAAQPGRQASADRGRRPCRSGRRRPSGHGRRAVAVGRQRELARHRTHQIRRDDDHQLGFRAPEAGRAEQGAKDRQVAEERRLVDVVGVGVAQQAGDHEALARAQLDGRFGPARGQRRDDEAVDPQRAFGRQFADLGTDAHRDAAVGEHDRRKRQADAILLIFDRDRAELPARPGSGIRRRPGSWRFRPTSAVRFGSASVVTRPSLSARSSVPRRSSPNSLPAAPSVVAARGANRSRSGWPAVGRRRRADDRCRPPWATPN